MNDPIRALETDRAKEIADYYAYIHDATNKGHREGKKEARQEMALNLLKAKMDISFIVETTGLSIEEIEKLKKSKS